MLSSYEVNANGNHGNITPLDQDTPYIIDSLSEKVEVRGFFFCPDPMAVSYLATVKRALNLKGSWNVRNCRHLNEDSLHQHSFYF